MHFSPHCSPQKNQHFSFWKTGETPLMAAARNKRVGVMKLLLNCKADPNGKGIYGQTAIFYAVDCIEALAMIIQYRADPNLREGVSFLGRCRRVKDLHHSKCSALPSSNLLLFRNHLLMVALHWKKLSSFSKLVLTSTFQTRSARLFGMVFIYYF